MKNALRAVFAGILALLVSAGYADSAIPARGPVPFGAFDSNGDGYVSRAEFDHVHEQRFSKRAGEQRLHRNMRPAPDFSEIDADGDGRLNPDELDSYRRARHQAWRQPHLEQMPGDGREAGTGNVDTAGKVTR